MRSSSGRRASRLEKETRRRAHREPSFFGRLDAPLDAFFPRRREMLVDGWFVNPAHRGQCTAHDGRRDENRATSAPHFRVVPMIILPLADHAPRTGGRYLRCLRRIEQKHVSRAPCEEPFELCEDPREMLFAVDVGKRDLDDGPGRLVPGNAWGGRTGRGSRRTGHEAIRIIDRARNAPRHCERSRGGEAHPTGSPS